MYCISGRYQLQSLLVGKSGYFILKLTSLNYKMEMDIYFKSHFYWKILIFKIISAIKTLL